MAFFDREKPITRKMFISAILIFNGGRQLGSMNILHGKTNFLKAVIFSELRTIGGGFRGEYAGK